MRLLKHIPITKVEEQADGTLHVYGIVTAEKPDRDKEVCDYEKTKPYYQKAVEEMKKATSVEGMEQSIMPLRYMHTLDAVGKGISIDFDDDAKTIRMGFEVVDAAAITKVKKGVLPAFSQGGDYVGKKVPDPVFPGCVRYVADPGEVSLVDKGCLSIALIETMKGQSFAFAKADGSTVQVPYDLPDLPNRADFDALRKKFDDLSAQVVANAPKPTLTDRVKEYLKAENLTPKQGADRLARTWDFMNSSPLKKSMWDVKDLADVMGTIKFCIDCLRYERDAEGDESTVPEDLHAVLESLVGVYLTLVDEETKELLAAASGAKGNKVMKITAENILEKAKSAHAHLVKAKEMVTAHHDKAVTMHKSHHDGMHAQLDKCVKALGGEEDQPETPEAVDPVSGGAHPHKAFDQEAFLATLNKSMTELIDKKLEENTTNVLKVVFLAQGGDLAAFEKAAAAAPAAAAPGVGDRSNVQKTAAEMRQTNPVNKDNDNPAPPADPAAVAKVTPDDVRAGFLKGDGDAMLKLAKSIGKPQQTPLHVVEAFQSRRSS